MISIKKRINNNTMDSRKFIYYNLIWYYVFTIGRYTRYSIRITKIKTLLDKIFNNA